MGKELARRIREKDGKGIDYLSAETSDKGKRRKLKAALLLYAHGKKTGDVKYLPARGQTSRIGLLCVRVLTSKFCRSLC